MTYRAPESSQDICTSGIQTGVWRGYNAEKGLTTWQSQLCGHFTATGAFPYDAAGRREIQQFDFVDKSGTQTSLTAYIAGRHMIGGRPARCCATTARISRWWRCSRLTGYDGCPN